MIEWHRGPDMCSFSFVFEVTKEMDITSEVQIFRCPLYGWKVEYFTDLTLGPHPVEVSSNGKKITLGMCRGRVEYQGSCFTRSREFVNLALEGLLKELAGPPEPTLEDEFFGRCTS